MPSSRQTPGARLCEIRLLPLKSAAPTALKATIKTVFPNSKGQKLGSWSFDPGPDNLSESRVEAHVAHVSGGTPCGKTGRSRFTLPWGPVVVAVVLVLRW